LQHLLFHIPDKVLLLLPVLLLLNLLSWGKFKPLDNLLQPVLKVAGFITPLGLHHVLLTLFTIVWLLALRVVFHMQMGSWGMLPGQLQ
jgi:hypothetical protein